jgi:transcriptional regulator with XRE-family HTH domain
MTWQIAHVEERNILRDLRDKLGLSQQQVADRAEIQLRQYQRFESGERKLSSSSFNIACRVIEALGMNISDYYHGEYVLGDKVDISTEG